MLNKDKVNPIRNYIYLLLIIILSIAFVYYLYLWFDEYKKEQSQTSHIEDVMQIINYNELETYLIENKDAIIYASTLNDTDIRKFEKKLQKLIKENDASFKILYLDLTNKKNKKGEYKVLEENVSLPTFLVYKNTDLITSYNINKKNYDIKEVKKYLEEIGVITND